MQICLSTTKLSKARYQVEVQALDLGDLTSVVAFGNKFNERKLPLNLLINNAGVSEFNLCCSSQLLN